MTQTPFGNVQFRNGIYQGQLNLDHKPNGLGLFLDDDLILHCSKWNHSKLNSSTAVIISHAKYIYGEWQDGMLHGFNVYRSGDTVMLGNFDQGKIVGQFIIIFERQNFVIVAYPNQNGFSFSAKREFSNEDQLKKIISNVIDNYILEEQYFSFVQFLNINFCSDNILLKLEFGDGTYHFGRNNGLGIIFDDENFISKVGCIDQSQQMCGLGALYSKMVEVGNFANGLVIKYRPSQKPVQDIKKLFKNQHKRSIFFRNDFLFTKTHDVIKFLDDIFKRVILAISENPIDTERSVGWEELNMSLEYRPKNSAPSQENQRLRMIREELHKSIGKPTNIKPSASEARLLSRYPEQIRQLHFTRSEVQFQEQDSISFSKTNGKSKNENRLSFLKSNKLDDYRDVVYDQRSTHKSKQRLDSQTNKNGYSIKSSNKESHKQSRSPIKQTEIRDRVEKSPSRHHIHKDSNMSTAHRDNKGYRQFQPVDNFNSHDCHTNKRVQELMNKINNPKQDSLESPFRKQLFSETIRQSPTATNRKSNVKRNSSRQQYIPVSHHETIKPRKSPQRQKQQKHVNIKQFPRKQFKELDKSARSYLALYKNTSSQKGVPNKQAAYNSSSKKSVSPLKNPYYQREKTESAVSYTKQPIRGNNPYVLKRSREEERKQSPENRHKMVQKISRKYNYVYDNL